MYGSAGTMQYNMQHMGYQQQQVQPSYHQHHHQQQQHQQVVVVDPRFCFPQQTVLTMQEQLGAFRNDNFTITDAHGRPFFNLQAASLSFSDSRQLLDCYNVPILHMQKKIPSFRGSWLINRASDRVRVATVRPATFSFTPSIKVFLNDGDEEADFLVQGDFRAKKFDIVQVHRGSKGQQRVIASVKKESRFSNGTAFLMSMVAPDTQKYFVAIEPGVDAAFIVALATLCDEMFHDQKA